MVGHSAGHWAGTVDLLVAHSVVQLADPMVDWVEMKAESSVGLKAGSKADSAEM